MLGLRESCCGIRTVCSPLTGEMLDMCKELFLLRHGRSAWNGAGGHQGQLESRLTQAGQAQARAMGLVRGVKDPGAMRDRPGGQGR